MIRMFLNFWPSKELAWGSISVSPDAETSDGMSAATIASAYFMGLPFKNWTISLPERFVPQGVESHLEWLAPELRDRLSAFDVAVPDRRSVFGFGAGDPALQGVHELLWYVTRKLFVNAVSETKHPFIQVVL